MLQGQLQDPSWIRIASFLPRTETMGIYIYIYIYTQGSIDVCIYIYIYIHILSLLGCFCVTVLRILKAESGGLSYSSAAEIGGLAFSSSHVRPRHFTAGKLAEYKDKLAGQVAIYLSIFLSFSLSLSLSIHVYIYIYTYTCTHTHTYTHEVVLPESPLRSPRRAVSFLWEVASRALLLLLYTTIVCTYLSLYTYIYIYIYVCTYIYIYIYIYMCT